MTILKNTIDKAAYQFILLAVLVAFSSVFSPLSHAYSNAMDLVLVLDNSGSMKKNDPNFLVPQAIEKFIQQQSDETQISVIIFDKNVNLSLPFLPVINENHTMFSNSLDTINYKGLYTDSPAAIERAIYELKNYAREDSQKNIVFLTDGIVDTGKPEFDLEKTRWLKQELAADAVENNIKIYSIGFTENADFQLIQSLAQQTQGEYYRALKPSELETAFNKIHSSIRNYLNTLTSISTKNTVEVIEENIASEPSNEPAIEVKNPSEKNFTPQVLDENIQNNEVPINKDIKPYSEQLVDTPILVAQELKPITEQVKAEDNQHLAYVLFGLFTLVLGALIYWFWLRPDTVTHADEFYISEAYLLDVHKHTKEKKYQLTDQVTMVGRVQPSDNEQINFIVIPETTIGRRHALFEYRDYSFWVVDQGSTNGTYVNDKLIEAATRLKDGDRVRFHKFEFVFEVPELQEDGVTEVSATILKQAVHERAKELPEPQFDITLQKSDLFDSAENEAITEFNSVKTSEDEYILDSEDETILPEQAFDMSLESQTDTEDPDKS